MLFWVHWGLKRPANISSVHNGPPLARLVRGEQVQARIASTATEDQKLFTGTAHSGIYHQYRPMYPSTVYNAIMKYLNSARSSYNSSDKIRPRYRLAVDMACGTGQGTKPLAEHFDKVIGFDVSESQISEAQRHNNISNINYRVASAEQMPFLPDGGVDLVTCAMAFHWFEEERAYQEMRVLNDGGVLAIYSYGLPILDTQDAKDAMDEYWHVTLKPFYSSANIVVMNHYQDLHPPLSDVTRLRSALPMGTHTSPDPIIHVSYPVFVILGRK